MFVRLLGLALLWLLATASHHATARDWDALDLPNAPLPEQVLMLPSNPLRPANLQVTLYMPPGKGPFPLAVVNHGANNASYLNRGERNRYGLATFYFMSRGYAVALPMARGFAGSEGQMAQGGCFLDNQAIVNAQDLGGVIGELGHLPNIDGHRVVVAGQSYGGWTALALTTMDIPGVRGVIGFSPALRNSNCPTGDRALMYGARTFGAAARMPSIWFYGTNDSIMPVDAWRTVFENYTAQGGRAQLVEVGKFMNDSHQLLGYPEGLRIWVPRVDAFLTRVGLPSKELHPEYMPPPFPLPSHFADLTDVSAVPGLDSEGQEIYRRFLKLPFPRAFALSDSGSYAYSMGGFDPVSHAVSVCSKPDRPCRPYAVDEDVVWKANAAVRSADGRKP